MTPPIGFYVYELIDPRDGLPFYVGKGQGRRAWQHQQSVKRGGPEKNVRKVAKINEILQAGAEVEVRIVEVYDLELDALDHEYRLVDANPTLTNVLPGGTGRIESPEMAARRAETRRRKLIEKRKQAREEARQRDLARVSNSLRVVPGAAKHRAEIDAWMASLNPRVLRNWKKVRDTRADRKSSKEALAAFRASKPA